MVFKDEYTYKADIWSIGSIVFSMINTVPPFVGNTVAEFGYHFGIGDYTFNEKAQDNLTIEQLLFIVECLQYDE